jgi:transposase
MARYGQKFKDAVVARLLPPESSSLEAVSQKVGISVATLERWRAAALATSDGNGSARPWTPAARLEAVIATAAMDEAARSAWCREHGLFLADLDRWKQDALGGLGEPRDDGAAEAKQDQRRIKELERDLSRNGECQASCRMACVMVFVYATPLFRVFDWLWSKAAWTTASRSGLSVTAAIGVQFRV